MKNKKSKPSHHDAEIMGDLLGELKRQGRLHFHMVTKDEIRENLEELQKTKDVLKWDQSNLPKILSPDSDVVKSLPHSEKAVSFTTSIDGIWGIWEKREDGNFHLVTQEEITK